MPARPRGDPCESVISAQPDEPVVRRRLEEDPGTPARIAEERLEARDLHVGGGYGCGARCAGRIRLLCEDPAGVMPRSSLPRRPTRAGDARQPPSSQRVAVAFAASPLPRITPDSASYLTGAERIAAEGRFESCAGPITLFAPGYSAALAPLVAVGLSTHRTQRVSSTCSRRSRSSSARASSLALPGCRGRVAIVVALAVAVSYATLRNGALVWSEPLFCAILAWLLAATLDRGRGLDVRLSARVLGVVVLTWALLLTRHSGIFVLPAIVLAGWLGSASTSRRPVRVGALRARAGRRSRPLVGAQHRRRRRSVRASLGVSLLPSSMCSSSCPTASRASHCRQPFPSRCASRSPCLSSLAAALAWRRRPDVGGSRAAVAVLTTAAVVYVLAVTASAAQTVVDPIDTRLLSPVLAPVAVLVALGVSSPRTRLERVLGVFALGVVVATALLAPGVAWRGHEAERTLAKHSGRHFVRRVAVALLRRRDTAHARSPVASPCPSPRAARRAPSPPRRPR